MGEIIATSLLGIFALGSASATGDPSLLHLIQGAWWSDCQDPAAELVIDGNEYSGDFLGTYKLELSGDVLVFKNGLVDGHSIDVTHAPIFFRVMSAGSGQLVLRPLPESFGSKDWRLDSCSSK
jgi:hypothetical protein